MENTFNKEEILEELIRSGISKEEAE